MGYRHTKLYSSKSEQFTDISGKSVFTVANCSYFRDSKRIRVTIPMSIAYTVNYLIYKNTNFENKYFYAFVTSCNYINNEVCEFTFEIDVIQTWMFDYEIRPSFVVRQHIANDAIGASLTEESFEIGDPIVAKSFADPNSRNFKICVLTSFKATYDSSTGKYTYATPEGKYYGKTYSGLEMNFFGTDQSANGFIKAVVEDEKTDGIVAIFMCPEIIVDNPTQVAKIAINLYPFNEVDQPSAANTYYESNLFQGYVPKNKKLYQYPYRFVKVLNGRGGAAVYKWENSGSKSPEGKNMFNFRLYAGGSSNPEMILAPTYNGEVSVLNPSPSYSLTNGGCVQCSWSSDAYKAWLAQNQGQLQYMDTHRTLTLARGVVDTFLGGNATDASWSYPSTSGLDKLSGGDFVPVFNPSKPVGSSNSVRTAANTLVDWADQIARKTAILKDHEVLPPEAHVATTAGQLAQDSGKSGFTIQCCCIRKEYAQIIDDYFDMFGYSVNKVVQTINRHTRQHFNYIKTMGCLIKGALPGEDKYRIEKIYDNGITFWHTNLDLIGNYSLENGSVT
jgi:hypothetical protein